MINKETKYVLGIILILMLFLYIFVGKQELIATSSDIQIKVSGYSYEECIVKLQRELDKKDLYIEDFNIKIY